MHKHVFLVLGFLVAMGAVHARTVTLPAGLLPPDEDFDEVVAPNLPAGWTTQASGAGSPWITTAVGADTAPNAAFASEFNSISDMTLTTPPLIADSSSALTFRHRYNLQDSFDGAVLEVSIGGAPFEDITAAGGRFASGGYDKTISSASGNPIGGRDGWTGDSGGYVTSQVLLPESANGLQTQFRFRSADDLAVVAAGSPGWLVDTIHFEAINSVFCGGFESADAGSCFVPDLVPGSWTTAASGPSARYRAGATSNGNHVFVFGGGYDATFDAALWRWDADTENWTRLADMPTAKQNVQGSYLLGKIYVPGGYNGSEIGENAIYDIATNTWTTGAPLPVAHSGATAAYGGKIYVFGGNDANSRVDVYDPHADTWTQLADFPTDITYGRAITVGRYIYYVGGIRGGTTTADVWRYDPGTDSYVFRASLHTPRASEELMTKGGRIYAVNGGGVSFFTGVPAAETVEIYDIATDTWAYGAHTVVSAAGSSGGLAGGKLMIMGGINDLTYYDAVQVSDLIPE